MSLNGLPAKDNYRREVRTEWGGINRNENAGDGELIEALNMSSREYPLLATRREWYRHLINGEHQAVIDKAAALGASKRVFWASKVSDTWKFFYNFTAKGTLSALTQQEAAKIRFVVMQDKIFIFPDKKVYDETAGTFESMEATWTGSATFDNGTYNGVAADANTIKGTGIGSSFHVGDAVTISGCVRHPNNNQSIVIREVSENELRFYENSFDLDTVYRYTVNGTLAAGTYYFLMSAAYNFTLGSALSTGATITFGEHVYNDGPGFIVDLGGTSYVTAATLGISGTYLEDYLAGVAYTESSDVTITRAVPDMDFVCVNENRMWGCKGDTIYASKPGDPLNWNVYDGISTDSWTMETGTPEEFTGCVSYQGYPVFFKANAVFRVMGDTPNQFTIRKMDIPGVSVGSDLSIAVVESLLYYLADKGVCVWNGSSDPSVISTALGIDRRWVSGRAGSDGKRYYLSAFEMIENPEDYAYSNWVYIGKDLCYDTRFGTWHELRISEEEIWSDVDRPVGYSRYARQVDKLYFLDSDSNNLLVLEGVPDASSVGTGRQWGAEPSYANSHDWTVTFADSTRAYKTALTGSESKKGVLRLLIRCRLTGSMAVWISYDGGDFEKAAEFEEMNKTSKAVPLILRRCDFWQLRLTGTGDAVIYSIAVEKYGGEWRQA